MSNQCEICNTKTSYDRERCYACAIAFDKGYEKGIEDYSAMFKHMLETHRIVPKK